MSTTDIVLTLGPRALDAIEAYADAAAAVSGLTPQIATALRECQRADTEHGPHLIEAYADKSDDGERRPEGYILALIQGCDPCRNAYALIKQRTEARKKLGVAKRRLSVVARKIRSAKAGTEAGLDPRQIALFEESVE